MDRICRAYPAYTPWALLHAPPAEFGAALRAYRAGADARADEVRQLQYASREGLISLPVPVLPVGG